jgi:23S rRNA (uracil1939-C5)-methyltransferase
MGTSMPLGNPAPGRQSRADGSDDPDAMRLAPVSTTLESLVGAGCVPECPGCAHRLLDKTASERQKRDYLQAALAPWAEVLQPLLGVSGAQRWGYRSRACLSVERSGGSWRVGLRRRDCIVDISGCPVHDERLRRCLTILRGAWPTIGGFALAWYVQNGAQITLVLKTVRRPDLSWLDRALGETLARAGAEGLWLHLNPATGKRIFAKPGWELIWGQGRSRDQRGLWYGPTTFQQPLDVLYERALELAEEFLVPEYGELVLDLYCGTGASLQRWLARGATVTGVELSGEAVDCARANVPAAQILRGSCAQRLPQLDEQVERYGRARRRLLYVNPPRTGLDSEVLDWCVARFRPDRMAYLSCSAGTLARDLSVLEAGGYRVVALRPLDFFPQTYHVETLALLARS